MGHYLGVRPYGAELALDKAISAHLFRRGNGARAARRWPSGPRQISIIDPMALVERER